MQGVQYINPNIQETAPWLVNGNGRVLMLFTMAVLIPAIFMNNMSSVGLAALPACFNPQNDATGSAHHCVAGAGHA